ncbi:MAG: iron dependent repressor, metal binding and dimerization domain protein [Clostridiales bacterium]|nr:iron dependent repressor, metal binding and dimerization domain protein [Clostridiales bacterium]
MNENREFHTVRGYQLLGQEKRILTSAMEDYLEMIYRNSLEAGSMRINTLSELLNVQPSSATKMVQKLTKAGMVDYQKYGIIFLTEKGKRIGEFLYNRHNIIETFLECIGISENPFVETELIEHHISPQTIQNINLFNCFIKKNPDLKERFEKFKNSSTDSKDN